MKILDIADKPFHEMRYRSSGPKGTVRKLLLPFYRARVDALPPGITTFVATSDLQGRETNKRTNRLLGEAVVEELGLLQELGEVPKIDFALLAGDLYDYPDCHKLGGTGDITSVWNSFAQGFGSVIGVHGNHDWVLAEHLAPGVTILDGHCQHLHGFRIGGVSGIVGRPNRNQRKTELEFQAALQKAMQTKTDILVLHQGPDDPDHGQRGEPLIREYLLNHGSSLVLFGHCHWSQPWIEIGQHQVLNVDGRLYLFAESF
jgi:Icc-related predicted phosphoesterase